MGASGLNVCGFFGGDFGLAQAARACVRALQAADIPYSIVNYGPRWAGTGEWVDHGERQDATLFVVNPDFGDAFFRYLGHRWLQGQKAIVACWHWELEELPRAWMGHWAPFQEIWVTSSFVGRTVRKYTPNVRTIPIPIDARASDTRFPFPAGAFKVLTMFDGYSAMVRKNPLDAIEAFKRASIPNGYLIVKGQNITPDEYSTLARAMEGVAGEIITGSQSRQWVYDLIAHCDALLSLHCSEGYGLAMAEAMALGTPAIATGYGGNVDFMRPGGSLLVDYTLGPIPKNAIYRQGQWAHPSLDDAAGKLNAVAVDSTLRESLISEGRRIMAEEYSPEAIGEVYRGALASL